MKKFGFTLVEVLMTLGIIGVVGMLVTPSLMQNGRNETNAARLSTAVSNFENALATGLATDGAEDLYHWDVWTNPPRANGVTEEEGFYSNLTRFMVLNGHATHEDVNNLMTLNGYYLAADNVPQPVDMTSQGARGNNSFNPGNIYTSLRAKNGALIYIADKINADANAAANENAARGNGSSLYSIAANIIIDVNGEAGPNIVGRDVFAFALSNEGTLFPYGSQETATYGNGFAGRLLSNALATNDCDLNAQNNGGVVIGIRTPITCTARVVENGYRIDY